MQKFIQISILIIILIFILQVLNPSSEINDNISNIISLNKAKNCEDEVVKNMVLEIFKENDYYYKDIDKSTISSVSLQYPAITSYDKDIDKYSCTGVISMKSVGNGFKPIVYNDKNNYYSKISSIWNNDTIKKYTNYKVNVTYYSQISENNILVQSTDYTGEFSCEGNCEDIVNKKYIEDKKFQVQQQQKKDKEEHLNIQF